MLAIDHASLRQCGACFTYKDGSIEFLYKQLDASHTSDVACNDGKGIDMNPDGGTAVTADDIAPSPNSSGVI
ncbi:hypothetical protein KCP75_26160 [Salmonella enterica subsp. enterica]|nr:hypothetical protein KCP75_26160 [Salmonella enterica subsp. enterica]